MSVLRFRRGQIAIRLLQRDIAQATGKPPKEPPRMKE